MQPILLPVYLWSLSLPTWLLWLVLQTPPLAYISARYGHRPFTSLSSLSDCQRTAPAVHLCFVVRSRNCSSLQLRFRTSSIRSCYFIRYIAFFLIKNKLNPPGPCPIFVECPIIADQLPRYGHPQVEPSLCSKKKETWGGVVWPHSEGVGRWGDLTVLVLCWALEGCTWKSQQLICLTFGRGTARRRWGWHARWMTDCLLPFFHRF